jgi:pyridoxal phosphate enzyme (YggS family)
MPVEGIRARIAEVRARIERAAARARRDASEVRLIAVGKGHPVAALEVALGAGCRELAESYVQELAHKAAAPSLRTAAEAGTLGWHFVGRLQRNKVKALAEVPGLALVHAVDRTALVGELARRAAASGRTVSILIEVALAGEAQKGGVDPAALGALIAEVERHRALALAGLMTVPPAGEDAESARPFFRRLRELRDAHGGAARLPELSMGMSHDLEVAVEEGASIVRVGTAIFGPR